MQLIRRLCLLCFFFTIHSIVCAQDTLSLFYMTARYQLTEVHKVQIGQFLNTLDKSELDSIQIIGLADSTGNQRANDRLSLRRASQVEHFLRGTGVIVPMHLLAKGEDPDVGNNLQKQRRVDIVLYFKSILNESEVNQYVPISDTQECFVAFDYLRVISHSSIIYKGKKEYMQIEVHTSDFTDTQKLYTVHVDANTKLPSLKKVKWKVVETGEDWVRKKRFVTIVPLDDYIQYGVVKQSNVACDSIPSECGFRLSDSTIQLAPSVRLIEAVFLLNTIRVKRKFFKRKYIKIIAPIEYTGEEPYFYDEQGKNQVFWYKKKGRRRKHNYYAEVHQDLLKDGELTLYHFESVSPCFCQFHPCDGSLFKMPCRPGKDRSVVSIGLEIGDKNSKPTHFGYIGLYAKQVWHNNELNVLLGLDTEFDPFLSLRFDAHFWSFARLEWLRKSDVYYSRDVLLYGGSTFDLPYRNLSVFELNQDVHLGIDHIHSLNKLHFQRLFLEGGVMLNYLNTTPQISAQFRLGLQFYF